MVLTGQSGEVWFDYVRTGLKLVGHLGLFYSRTFLVRTFYVRTFFVAPNLCIARIATFPKAVLSQVTILTNRNEYILVLGNIYAEHLAISYRATTDSRAQFMHLF